MISFLRQYVFHNFLLKLMALIIAALLWMAVNNEPTSEIAVTVPIEFQHVPQGIEITSERIPAAQVRVSGPGRVVRRAGQLDRRCGELLERAATEQNQLTMAQRTRGFGALRDLAERTGRTDDPVVRQRLAAHLGEVMNKFFRGGGIDVPGGDARAFLREPAGRSAANAGGGSRNDDDLIAQTCRFHYVQS
jgi:hypothetical protein